ncbi:MAG: HAD family phosphatase [archaeon]
MKAVLFDMDGVIADTEPQHFEAARLVLQDFGFDLDETKLIEYIGLSEEDVWKKVLLNFPLHLPFKEFERKRRLKFRQLVERTLQPNVGLYELLIDLKNNHIMIALVTSSGKEIAELILDKLSISSFFSVIVTADDVTRKKPHTEPYRKALQLLSIDANEAVAVEDSAYGIISAKNSGITAVGIKTNHGEEILDNADKIISTLKDLNFENLSRLTEH